MSVEDPEFLALAVARALQLREDVEQVVRGRYVGPMTVVDPDSGGVVELEVWKDPQSGGIFAVDASYLEGVTDMIPSPFSVVGQEVYLHLDLDRG